MSEEGYKPSAEEVAANQKSRTLSDAELIKFGAEYVPNEDGNNPRLEVTSDQWKNREYEMNSENEPKRQEIIKRNEKIDFQSLVQSTPELKDKIDCIDIEKENKNFLIRLKDFPTIGIIVSEVDHGGDQTRLHFNYVDENAPMRTVYKEVVSPVPGDLIRNKDGSSILRSFQDNSKNDEYFRKATEIVGVLEKICAENGITTLAIRQGNAWEDWKLPKPHGIEIVDARYEDVFTDTLGMPDYVYDDLGGSSERFGYDAKKPYPTFDWHREN